MLLKNNTKINKKKSSQRIQQLEVVKEADSSILTDSEKKENEPEELHFSRLNDNRIEVDLVDGTPRAATSTHHHIDKRKHQRKKKNSLYVKRP